MYDENQRALIAERKGMGFLCPIPADMKEENFCNATGRNCRPIFGPALNNCPCNIMPEESVAKGFWGYIFREEIGDCAIPYSTY